MTEEFELRVPLINQNHHNLIPFTYKIEEGIDEDIGDKSELGFVIETIAEDQFNSDGVTNRNNSVLTLANGSPTVYVPQGQDGSFVHDSSFYVDVIAKDVSGIKEIRTHVEPDAYQFEVVNNSYITPQFSWDNSIWEGETTTTTSVIGFMNSFWVGSSDAKLERI